LKIQFFSFKKAILHFYFHIENEVALASVYATFNECLGFFLIKKVQPKLPVHFLHGEKLAFWKKIKRIPK